MKADEKLEFVQYHKPALTSGDYAITVTNTIKTASSKINETFEPTTRHFSVQGNRFTLSPTDIHSVYPPRGSFRDYHLVLPHIVLNRTTLPWEREPDNAQGPQSGASWLALLLFVGSEVPVPEVVPLDTLEGITLETGQSADDKITIIKVKKSLLEAIVPSYADLEFLSHIRLSKDETGNVIGGEKATILCNRLPKEDSGATVHLVSLEGRYSKKTFQFGAAKDEELITLVSLYSWSFTCAKDKGSYEAILKDLTVGALHLPLLQKTNNDAEEFKKKGYVPLRHTMRMGQKTVSWYHGPLAPARIDWPALPLPAKSADELLHYNPTNGLFDVSYAAAWEHGRMLALKDPKFSMALFHLKKELLLNQRKFQQLANWKYIMPTGSFKDPENNLLGKAEDMLLHGTLSEKDDYGVYRIPEVVETFFDNLRLLKGVAFDYLVPHEDMLPPESIRFFRIDPVWMDCLLDGAYSLGEDAERSVSNTNSPSAHAHEAEITGFLLRSEVIRGWPGLLINAYGENLDGLDENETKKKKKMLLKALRKEYLSEEVLLMLFGGDLHTVDFSIAPDTLHFGLDEDEDGVDVDGPGDSSDPITGKFWQVLRNEDGVEDGKLKIKTVPFRGSAEKLVVNMKELASAMVMKIDPKLNPDKDTVLEKNSLEVMEDKDGELVKVEFSSAHFALQMTEGAPKVRILRKK